MSISLCWLFEIIAYEFRVKIHIFLQYYFKFIKIIADQAQIFRLIKISYTDLPEFYVMEMQFLYFFYTS